MSLIISPITDQEKSRVDAFDDREWHTHDVSHFGRLFPEYGVGEVKLKAESDGQVIGTVYGFAEMGVLQVTDLLVMKSHQGMGVGSVLLQAAIDACEQLALHKVIIFTGVNWDTHPFYLKHGFVKTTILNDLYGRQDFVVFEKTLVAKSES